MQWLGDQRASPPAWLHRMEEVWQSAGCFCTAVCCRTACCAYLRRNHGGCCWLWEQPALTNENPRPNHSNHYGSIPTKPPFSLSLRPYRNRIVSASAARETPPPELPAYRALPPLCPSICTCASTAVPLHLHMCLYRCAPPSAHVPPPLCPSSTMCAATAVPLHLHMCFYRCAPPSAHVLPPLCPSSTMCAATVVPLHLHMCLYRCAPPSAHVRCSRCAPPSAHVLPPPCPSSTMCAAAAVPLHLHMCF